MDWGTTEQQTVGGSDTFETGDESAAMVLETLTFVHYQVSKLPNLIETLLITDGNLITRNNNGEIIFLSVFGIQRSCNHCISFRLGAMETNDGVGW